MKKNQNLKEIFKPNEMPTIWGSTAKPNLPPKIRTIYAIGFIVILIAGMFQNNLTIANIYEIQGKLGLTMEEGSYITALYYMGSSWMSLVLFKIRQHIGVNKFIIFVMVLLMISHTIVIIHDSFLITAIGRLLNGFVGNGITVLCIYYAMQMLPNNKKYLLMPLSMGLLQTGAPIAKFIVPHLMINEDASLPVYFELGLTLFVLAALILIELPPSEAKKSIHRHDIISFLIYGMATAITCLTLSVGTVIWWDKAWIAYAFCASLILFLLLFLIELNRDKPVINFSFATTFNLLKIAFAGGFIRMSLTEQSIGMAGFFKNISGFSDYQLMTYYGVLSLGALFGGILSIFIMTYKRSNIIFTLSFCMIMVGSFLIGNISTYTSPQTVYLSQFLIAASGVLFVAPLFISGFINALARGISYVLTFVAVFSFSQSFFGLLGTALIGYFIKIRSSQYLQDLINRISNTNSLFNLDPNLSVDLTKEAGAMAYSDLFNLVGIISGIVFAFLIAEFIYYHFSKKVPSQREFAILGKRAQILERKTKNLEKSS